MNRSLLKIFVGRTWPKKKLLKKKNLDLLFWIQNNYEFSEVQFKCIFNDFSFLLDISSKINLHVWFYFIVVLTILYIT